jgi:hypothetical protein
MKEVRILALAATLALGSTLTAYAQSENPTSSDQHMTTASDPTVIADSRVSPHQAQSSLATPSGHANQDGAQYNGIANDRDWSVDPQADRLQELQNDSGAN